MASAPPTAIELRAPLIESFEIHGLYGYKSLRLHCEANAKVVAAENGSGKTTLLNSLYAFLAGKVGPLVGLDFRHVVLKFRGKPAITARKDDLFPQIGPDFVASLRDVPAGRQMLELGLRPDEVRELLILYLTSSEELEQSGPYRKLFEDSPLDSDDIRKLCQQLSAPFTVSGLFADIQKEVKHFLNGTTVLYLPTYRRIEADIPEYRRRRRAYLTARTRSDWDTDRLIFFGMQDVQARLKSITGDIRRGTFDAYSRISAKTLDQLLWISQPSLTDPSTLDLTTLRLVLARLGRAQSDSEARIVELIQTERINEARYDSLRALLAQLSEIYKEKRDAEVAIENFVDVINRYWRISSDPKELRFDKLRVEVEAFNTVTGAPLPLGSLSSGEKQILSVFARLNLDWGKRYIILIDEPELSLSLEWQRTFLPDILRAKSCEQLIAITHSPFVFENELDKVSGSLLIDFSRKQ